jgi:hypothetical protein
MGIASNLSHLPVLGFGLLGLVAACTVETVPNPHTPGAGGSVGAGGSSPSGGAQPFAGAQSSGGAASGGAPAVGGANASGGVASGGVPGTGGTPASSGGSAGSGTSGSGGSAGGDDWFPCDGDTSVYDVVVTGSGNSWQVTPKGGSASSAGDMAAAMTAGFAALTQNRSSKETMLVQGSGSIDASAQFRVPSYIVLNICGTIDVTGTPSGSDRSPLYARDRTDIDIPHVTMTGNPQYGIFFRSVSNIHLGQVSMILGGSSGIGVRIDNNPSGGGAKVQNVQIDYMYAEGMGSHGIETYGVDNITIGRLDGLNTGECGVLLNDTTNAEVGVVHCDNCAEGNGYAAFRIANDAGKIGNDWPANNIHVGEVYARDGGRGIFSVSGSGGLTIDRIDLADTGNNAILLQNCYNTTIAAVSGTITNGSVTLSNDTANTDNGTFAASQNVTLQNLTLSNGSVTEGWCQLGDRGNRAVNITGGNVDMCF